MTLSFVSITYSGLSDEPSWTTESRKDGEDKRRTIKGWRIVACVCDAAESGDLRRRKTDGEEGADALDLLVSVGVKEVPA